MIENTSSMKNKAISINSLQMMIIKPRKVQCTTKNRLMERRKPSGNCGLG
jgi:hypothetical protein